MLYQTLTDMVSIFPYKETHNSTNNCMNRYRHYTSTVKMGNALDPSAVIDTTLG